MRWALVVMLVTAAFASDPAKRHTIDLKPFGYEPTRNEDLRPREFVNEVEWMPDGSLVVAFRSASLVAGARKGVRDLQPTEMVRVDADSGKLLARTNVFVSRNTTYLHPSPVGVLAVEGAMLVEYSPDLKPERRYSLTENVAGVDLWPETGTAVVYSKSAEPEVSAAVLDLRTQSVRADYKVKHGARIAPLRDGYAVTAHDKDGRRVVRIVGERKITDVGLPMLPCPTHIATVAADAAVAVTCFEWTLFDGSGRVIANHRLGSNEDSPYLFASGGRFGMATYMGFAGYPKDEQRIFAKAMRVTVYEVATGQKMFATDVSPMPKLGGSCALSQDGRRLAILKDGEVEIIDLP